MMLGFHPRRYYHYAYAENQYLASLGFVVLSVNYRRGLCTGGPSVRQPMRAGGARRNTRTLLPRRSIYNRFRLWIPTRSDCGAAPMAGFLRRWPWRATPTFLPRAWARTAGTTGRRSCGGPRPQPRPTPPEPPNLPFGVFPSLPSRAG